MIRGHSITMWTREGEGPKIFVFVHALGIENVHVVNECPLIIKKRRKIIVEIRTQ